jgi:anti-anti-sigma factor
MQITTSRDGARTTLSVNGRVDANTARALQDEIMKAVQSSSNVVLDFSGVDYINSAGLRALLMGHKAAAAKFSSMELINVRDNVSAILDAVGFTKILTIK